MLLALIIILHMIGGLFVFAFLMQWNWVTMETESIKEVKGDWESDRRFRAILRWYIVAPFVVAWRIWKTTKGMRWFLPVGFLLILIGQVLFRTFRPYGW